MHYPCFSVYFSHRTLMSPSGTLSLVSKTWVQNHQLWLESNKVPIPFVSPLVLRLLTDFFLSLRVTPSSPKRRVFFSKQNYFYLDNFRNKDATCPILFARGDVKERSETSSGRSVVPLNQVYHTSTPNILKRINIDWLIVLQSKS